MYNLPNHKVSNQFKSYNGFLIYPPLWTSYIAAVHDDIENRSIEIKDNPVKHFCLVSAWYNLEKSELKLNCHTSSENFALDAPAQAVIDYFGDTT